MFKARDRSVDPSRNAVLSRFRRLGGSVGVKYCRRADSGRGVQEVQAVFLSCSRAEWVKEFGEPQQIENHLDRSGRQRQIWQQTLRDGPLQCVGQFFERAPGNDWVVVKQLSKSRAEDPSKPNGKK